MNQFEKFADVTTFIFDVDGVLTDSTLLVTEEGKLLRRMHVRDGYALKRAIQAGFKVIVITGGNSEGVRERLYNLGINDVALGVSDKVAKYGEFIDLYNLDEDGILYMGDDMPDYDVMRRVGFAVCPHDACPEIKSISTYISPVNGGHGCVREVIERVLKIQRKWEVRKGSETPTSDL
ncbi:MAG: HAD hydrolase family protein [Saprospiraceae bacterium]